MWHRTWRRTHRDASHSAHRPWPRDEGRLHPRSPRPSGRAPRITPRSPDEGARLRGSPPPGGSQRDRRREYAFTQVWPDSVVEHEVDRQADKFRRIDLDARLREQTKRTIRCHQEIDVRSLTVGPRGNRAEHPHVGEAVSLKEREQLAPLSPQLSRAGRSAVKSQETIDLRLTAVAMAGDLSLSHTLGMRRPHGLDQATTSRSSERISLARDAFKFDRLHALMIVNTIMSRRRTPHSPLQPSLHERSQAPGTAMVAVPPSRDASCVGHRPRGRGRGRC